MQEFQERVITEKRELDEKLSRLSDFFRGDIFHGLPTAEQDRMSRQAVIMHSYSDILKERIDNWKD